MGQAFLLRVIAWTLLMQLAAAGCPFTEADLGLVEWKQIKKPCGEYQTLPTPQQQPQETQGAPGVAGMLRSHPSLAPSRLTNSVPTAAAVSNTAKGYCSDCVCALVTAITNGERLSQQPRPPLWQHFRAETEQTTP
jgi:hypothetical protein